MRRKTALKLVFLHAKFVSWLWRVKYHGLENLTLAEKEFTPYLLVGNHDNKKDGCFLCAKARTYADIKKGKSVFCVVRTGLYKRFIAGDILKTAKSTVGINRMPGCLTDKVIKKITVGMKKHGAGMMFIQSSSDKQHLRKVSTGPVRVALSSKVAVVPVGIYPRFITNFLKTFKAGSGVHITFGKPRYLKPCNAKAYAGRKKHYRKVTDELWEEVQKLIKHSKKEFNRR